MQTLVYQQSVIIYQETINELTLPRMVMWFRENDQFYITTLDAAFHFPKNWIVA